MSQAPGDTARDAAAEAKERVTEQAAQARDAAQSRLRDQVDTRSTQAGEQVSTTAAAVRDMGDQLRSQGQAGAARVSDEVANRLEHVGGYLRDSDAETILQDVEDFARRQPWVVIVAGIAVGVAGARFLKASSRRRYQVSGPPPPARGPAEPAPLPPVERRAVDEALTPSEEQYAGRGQV
jgi:hypothetical protein